MKTRPGYASLPACSLQPRLHAGSDAYPGIFRL